MLLPPSTMLLQDRKPPSYCRCFFSWILSQSASLIEATMTGDVTAPPAAPRAAFADCGAEWSEVNARRRVAAAVVVPAAMAWSDSISGGMLLTSRFSALLLFESRRDKTRFFFFLNVKF